jgi:tetratricopeptide (TPR) repeat protein
VAAGDALASRDAEGALAEYKKALLLVTPAQKEERADVYVRIGQVKLLQDKRREAISNFEKATQLSPSHRGALEEIAKLSAEERDWRGVAATEEKILASITDAGDRFARLVEFGERWANVAFDTDRARSAFTRAREIRPDDLDILTKLLRIHEATGAAAEAFELQKEIADKTPDARAQAERYAALGKRCLDEQKDDDAALAFFEKALDADPKMLEPLATAASILAERQEWSELEATYRRMLERTERIAENEIRRRLRWELNRRLALLFRDHLEDPEDALVAFESAIADQPDDQLTRQNAVTLARQLGKWEAARVHLQVLARLDPMVVQTYHDLFDVFQKLKRPDQAWAAASVTAQLGHADQRERFIYEEGKPDGPPKPTRALGADAWDLLRDGARDHAVEGVMEAITKAAIEAKLADLRAQGRLPQLDPAAKQDPKKSTVSIVRSFAWASHLLGVEMPAVYLRDDAQVGLAAVVAEEPAVIAGAGVLRGKTLAELAFAAGRHLAYHFGSHRLLLYYPVIDDLAACFLAAVRVVMPGASVPSRMEKAAAAMQGRIEPLLSAASRTALERAVVAFEAAGSRADLNGWVASVERCSSRAGYLLTSDLRTAATSLAAEGAGVLTVEQKMVDLLWFTVSEELHELRDALGIAIEP